MKKETFNNNPDNGSNDNFTKITITRRVELCFWKNCALIAFGILLASYTSGGAISVGNIFSYAMLIVTIWLFNFILRPFIVLFTLPFIVFTFGFGMVFINAFIIWIATGIIPAIKFSSYWWAVWAAFLIEVVSWAVAMFDSERIVLKNKKGNVKKNDDDDTIDIK